LTIEPVTAFDQNLWRRLEAYRIGPPDASLTFAVRLARENRWPIEYAERAIDEYKRFCYLAKTAGHEVTPSDAVDQVWHLHLTYSRDYWQAFCPDVLQAELHHGPTAGGQVERTRYYDQYAATLNSYEKAFGEPPPKEIWRDANRRFNIDPLGFRVNPRDAIVFSRPCAGLVAIFIAISALAVGWFLGGS